MAQAYGDQQKAYGLRVGPADAGAVEEAVVFAAQASAAAGQDVDRHYEEVHDVAGYVHLAYY